MRIGFFGGSFDPPHRGHMAVARAAAARFLLDEISFAPVGLQPLKADGAQASYDDRLAMVRLACADAAVAAAAAGAPGGETEGLDTPWFSVTELDGPRPDGGMNFTVDALADFVVERCGSRNSNGEVHCTVYSIVGADSFLDLRRWRDPDRLLELAEWIVVSRPGISMDREALAPLELTAAQRARVLLLPGVDEPVSATELRRRLVAGEPCGDWLAPSVERYIREHGLYGAVAL